MGHGGGWGGTGPALTPGENTQQSSPPPAPTSHSIVLRVQVLSLQTRRVVWTRGQEWPASALLPIQLLGVQRVLSSPRKGGAGPSLGTPLSSSCFP